MSTFHFGQIGNSEMKRMECYSVELFKRSQIQNVYFITIILDFEYLQCYTSYKTRARLNAECDMIRRPNDKFHNKNTVSCQIFLSNNLAQA